MFNLFKSKPKKTTLPLLVDIHSHLLPGLDDGVKSEDESLYILRSLEKIGYKKVITTPHVMNEYYPNNPSKIHARLEEIRNLIRKNNLDITLEAAAEYYLDETLMAKLSDQETLLTFGNNYLLFETSFLNKPAFLEDAIFNMHTNGYQPVLAHPERYGYLHGDESLVEQLKGMNVLFQMNVLSLTGYYSSEIKRMARYLLKENTIDLIGTDCHNAHQVEVIVKSLNTKNLKCLEGKSFLNPTLL